MKGKSNAKSPENTTIPADAPEFAGLCADILGRGASLKFEARGLSMRPAIMDGDLITVVPVKASQIKLGDVVLYAGQTGALRAHRVLAIKTRAGGKVLQIRGDSSTGVFEEIPSNSVLGRVVCATRNGKTRAISNVIPRYRALLRLGGRQVLDHAAPTASRAALRVLRRLGRAVKSRSSRRK